MKSALDVPWLVHAESPGWLRRNHAIASRQKEDQKTTVNGLLSTPQGQTRSHSRYHFSVQRCCLLVSD